MAIDASAMLHSPQLAGVKVNPLGLAARTAGRMGGVSGAGAGVVADAISAGVNNAMAMRAEKQALESAAKAQTPKFGRIAFLAASATELMLIELKTHRGVQLRLGEVIASVPRAQVASAKLGRGRMLLSPPLTVSLTDGTSWALEVPRPAKRRAKQLVRALCA
jgi:hypothetical protein